MGTSGWRHTFSKSQVYVKRVLEERPTQTRTGIPITVAEDGWSVRTYSGRSLNGEYSVYNPCDYPKLFGWEILDAMPWQYGTKVKLRPGSLHEDWNKYAPGTILGFRVDDQGNIDYKVRIWRTNQHWFKASDLMLYNEEDEEMAVILIEADVEEPQAPTLEERVSMIEQHLGITIKREPSKLIVEKNDEPDTEAKPEENEEV